MKNLEFLSIVSVFLNKYILKTKCHRPLIVIAFRTTDDTGRIVIISDRLMRMRK